MSPEEAAVVLCGEIEAALAAVGGSASAVQLRSVEPPVDLGADRCFRVVIESRDGRVAVDLPAGLAMAYLADEEAAVDEFKTWVAGLAA